MEKTGTKEYWSMTEGVFNCLIDKKRSLAFKKAIIKAVRQGDVVVDMGTGSGILAMIAAKAGARIVYAVENDPNNLLTLQETFNQNGLADKISLISGDVTKVKIPEKVDVIIGEMIATALIEELQVPAMHNILKYANSDCRVVLNKYETYTDLVFNNEEYYGCKFKIIRYEYPDMNEIKSDPFTKKTLIDTSDFGTKRENLKVSADVTLNVTKNGTINGVRLSGKTIFSDGSTLWDTYAYSYPIILPISDRKVTKGEKIRVSVSYKVSAGMQHLRYKVHD